MVRFLKNKGEIRMPRLAAKHIELSENQKRIIKQFADGTHVPQHLNKRARIIMLANQGLTNDDIEAILFITNHTVIKWRNRFFNSTEKLAQVEKETPLKLKEEIIKVLSDEQRPGTPSTFTDEQVSTIIALSLQDPQTIGFPFSHWTNKLLKIAVIDKGIVESISESQIRRFLKRQRS